MPRYEYHVVTALANIRGGNQLPLDNLEASMNALAEKGFVISSTVPISHSAVGPTDKPSDAYGLIVIMQQEVD